MSDPASDSEPRAWDGRRTLIVLLAVALALRLGWALSRPVNEATIRALPDQREYLELGRNLLAGRGLVMHDERLDTDVHAFRTPGYPLWIAACGGSVRAVRAVQALLDTSTVLAVFILARRWLDQRGSVAAAALVVFNPYLVYFTGLILSETLFIALLAWGMALLCQRGNRWILGAAILALSVLVRPSALLLGPLLATVSAVPRWSWARPTAVAALTLIVLMPWAWMNQRVMGAWVWTSTNSGFTMYDGFNPKATGASDQSFVVAMKPTLLGMSEIERSRYLNSLAWEFMRENPGRVIQLAFAKVARTWSPIPLSHEYGGDPKLVVVALLYTVPLFALILAGVWLAPIPRPAKVFLLLPAVYFTVAHAASVGSLRYRIPADVPMTIIAAGVVECRKNKHLASPI